MSFERVEMDANHVYRVGGVIVPSATEICNIIAPPNFSCVDPGILDYSRELGRAAHEMTAHDDAGVLDEPTVSDLLRPYLDAWRKFRSVEGFEVEEIELRVYSSSHRFAGTLDRRGRMKDRPAIVDIKTGIVDLASVGPQTALYELGDREWAAIGGRARDRFAVKLLDSGDYILIPCKDKRDYDTALYGLQIWNWRHVKHGSY